MMNRASPACCEIPGAWHWGGHARVSSLPRRQSTRWRNQVLGDLCFFCAHAVDILPNNDILLPDIPRIIGRTNRERKVMESVFRPRVFGDGSKMVFPIFARAGGMGEVGMRGAASAKA